MNPHENTPPGVVYSGDVHPVEHGGTWYKPADWEKYGSAPVLRVQQEEITGGWYTVDVEAGEVHRRHVKESLASCGEQPPGVVTAEFEVEACLGYMGADIADRDTFLLYDGESADALANDAEDPCFDAETPRIRKLLARVMDRRNATRATIAEVEAFLTTKLAAFATN